MPATERPLWEELGRLFRESGYAEGAVPGWREDPLLARRRLRADRLGTLVELFALGGAVDTRAARRALAPLDVERLRRAGLLAGDGDRVSARLRIDAVGALLFLCDPPPPALADHVTGVGAASRTLAALTVRRPVGRALDLGTGCGVQAVLAARDARSVVATDVNRRALALAAASTWLNETEGIEFREGSLYEPVEHDAFDLVVSNPPFVISPERAYVFRDSAEQEDLVRAVVAGAAERLRQGGFATVLCNWGVREGESWRDPVGRWLAGAGCDAWVLHYGDDEPLAYAAKWNAHLRSDEARYAVALDRWVAHHEAAGIVAVANGAVVLHRRKGGGARLRADGAAFGPSGSASDQIQRVFAAQVLLEGLASGERLLESALELVEPHRLDQALVFADSRYAAQPALLTLEEGAGVRVEVEPAALHVVFRLDGERPLGALVADAAQETELDEAEIRRASIAAARRLLGLGFATVADSRIQT